MKLFLFPFNVPSGGAAGISVLLYNFLHIPNGMGLFLINAVLLILAYRFYGMGFVLRTLTTVFLMSVTVDVIPFAPPIHVMWISATVGALSFGVSMAIILASGSTSGGMDILAKWAEQKWGRSFGTNLFAINTTILLTAGALLGWHVALFGIYAQFLSNATINVLRKRKPKMRGTPLKMLLFIKISGFERAISYIYPLNKKSKPSYFRNSG